MTHDGNVETLHHHFNNLVQNFSSTDNESVINLIKDMFKVTTFETILDGTKPMLKVKGYKIVLSEIYNSIIVRRSSKIKHIEINAKSVLVIDQNLHFRATNLILTANTVVIVKSIEFNLSGKNAVEEFRSKAKSGKMLGEKGSNGDDGIAGESSGHFALFAKSVEGLQNLKLILNGGNGSSGQNGGDGADGENGIGKDFDEVFNSTHTHLTRLKSAGHILTLGALSRVLSKKEALKSYDGRVEMKCDSSYYLSIHKLDMYVGSDGKPGGKGGKNGIGGDGGKKGNIVLEIDDGKNKIEEITVEAKDGVKGRDGISGINGQNGIEGRDIALANKTWGSRREFGKFQNSKLEIQECTSDDEEAICVKDGSKEEYFKVISRPCARTSLTEYQKQSEQKSDAERSGKAIAVESEAIDIEALSKNYQQIVTSETVTTEEEYEFGAEEGEEVNRILEHWTFDEREEYIPKRQYNAILYPEKMLSILWRKIATKNKEKTIAL
uniref:Uncharacterized protein n=1 Tax=Panagrolaimus superbus TaxID=310955 RepID=A0A914ZC12_9BILA